MSGLIISLKPNEKFLVNGIRLSNGPKRGQLCIEDDNVRILRLSDALHPDEATTPVKRAYYDTQLLLSCDRDLEEGKKLVIDGLITLQAVFQTTPMAKVFDKAINAASQNKFYSVLYALRGVFELEAELLAKHANQDQQPNIAMVG